RPAGLSLFPYTTLFRSQGGDDAAEGDERGGGIDGEGRGRRGYGVVPRCGAIESRGDGIRSGGRERGGGGGEGSGEVGGVLREDRSEEHTSELQSPCNLV